MPYIKKENRGYIDVYINAFIKSLQDTYNEDDIEGILNYTITRILCNCIKPKDSEWRYKYINRASGVLTQIQSEFNRRVKDPYEATCIGKNGDLEEFKNMKKKVLQ